MDRISNLPDEILHHIGSFLSAKEAAFATLLSKRWRTLFTIIPNLHFSGSLTGPFKDFADRVLAIPVSTRVRTFSLKCQHKPQYEDLINRCLRHVVNRGVLVLELHIEVAIKKGHHYSLPCDVFTCKTVSTMKIGSGFVIDLLPADVFLPSLKSLFLDSVRFHGIDGRRCSFTTLLSESPALEELMMDGIEMERWKWCSTVSSTTLQRLTIRRREWYSYEDPIVDDPRGLAYEFDSIGFDTPALTYLEYSDFVPKEYLTVNLGSLVEAKLNLCVFEEGLWQYEHGDTFNPINLIYGLINVEILSLTYETVEMFYFLSKSIPTFEKVSQLSVDQSSRCWYSLTIVMEKLPNLKTLIIEELHLGNQLVCDCVSEYSFLSSCSVEVLKINSYDGAVNDLEQMKHFLGKLSCLELVEVRAQAGSSDAELQIMDDLLMLPRASTKCKIQVKFLPKMHDLRWYTQSI